MTPSGETADPIDRITFEIDLQDLVSHARDIGIGIEGTYNVRSPRQDVPDYTIEVTEQTKRVTDGGTNTTITRLDDALLAGDATEASVQLDTVDRFMQ